MLVASTVVSASRVLDWSSPATVRRDGMVGFARRRLTSAPRRPAKMEASAWTSWRPMPAPVPWDIRASTAKRRFSSVRTIRVRIMPCA